MKLPTWLTKRLLCKACHPIRNMQPLNIQWPIQVYLDKKGANFLCHRCGRIGPIDRGTIPRM